MKLSSLQHSYSPEAYLEEKKNGDRLPNGAKPLKRLTAQHKQILLLHLSGLSNNDICESTGKTPATISRIINDPLARAEIAGKLKDIELEFEALYPKSVESLRAALDANTIAGAPAHTTRLKAIDIYYKASGKYKNAEESGDTAEDVIQRILQNPLVQINVNTEPQKPVKAGRVFDGEIDGDDQTD